MAHLALNAVGFTRAIKGASHHRAVPAYDSSEARESGIEKAASMEVGALRELLFDASGQWHEATRDVSEWDATFERTPGGPVLTIGEAVQARWREVEIHHADLGTGYLPEHWSPAFTDYVLAHVVESRTGELDATLETSTHRIDLGAGGRMIRGPRHALAWWLLGRGSGEGLAGDLPRLGPWR